jgi:hypothetical protein
MNNPAPPGWNKTTDDLFAEVSRGERRGVGEPEFGWAKDYERSLLPPDTVYPRAGQIWEVITECDVLVRHIFATAASSSSGGKLASGERVRISQRGSDPKPILVSFLPLCYKDLQDSLVPADVRNEATYTSYVLSVKTGLFNKHFRLIEDVV